MAYEVVLEPKEEIAVQIDLNLSKKSHPFFFRAELVVFLKDFAQSCVAHSMQPSVANDDKNRHVYEPASALRVDFKTKKSW